MKLELSSAQLNHLKGLAHHLDPIAWVGQSGITPNLIQAVDEGLLAHELIKVRLRKPEDKKASAVKIAKETSSVVCGLIGHTVILYRRHPEKPKIKFP